VLLRLYIQISRMRLATVFGSLVEFEGWALRMNLAAMLWNGSQDEVVLVRSKMFPFESMTVTRVTTEPLSPNLRRRSCGRRRRWCRDAGPAPPKPARPGAGGGEDEFGHVGAGVAWTIFLVKVVVVQ